MMQAIVEAISAALTGGGTREARRLGRVIIAIVSVVNLCVFFANVRSLLAYEEADVPPSLELPWRTGASVFVSEQHADLRPIGGLNVAGVGSFGGGRLNNGVNNVNVLAGAGGRMGTVPVNNGGAPLDGAVPLQRPSGPSAEELYGHHPSVTHRPLDEFVRTRRPAPAAPAEGTPGRDVPLIVTHTDAARFPELRHLVGSVHHWHPELAICVYVVGTLPSRMASELALWRNVRTRSANDALTWVASSATERMRKAGVSPEARKWKRL